MPTHDPNLPPKLVSRKVVGATAGAGVGGVLASIIVSLLGAYVFTAGVPDAVSNLVYVGVPLVLSFVSGYLTKRSAAEVQPPVVVAAAPAPVADAPNPPAPVKRVAAKKTAAKRPAKKAAPKPPTGLS